jgi:hypothetical protein
VRFPRVFTDAFVCARPLVHASASFAWCVFRSRSHRSTASPPPSSHVPLVPTRQVIVLCFVIVLALGDVLVRGFRYTVVLLTCGWFCKKVTLPRDRRFVPPFTSCTSTHALRLLLLPLSLYCCCCRFLFHAVAFVVLAVAVVAFLGDGGMSLSYCVFLCCTRCRCAFSAVSSTPVYTCLFALRLLQPTACGYRRCCALLALPPQCLCGS